MPKYILVLTLCALLAGGSVPALAEPPEMSGSGKALAQKDPPAEPNATKAASKQDLIREYLSITRVKRNAEMGFNLVLDQMARGMKASFIDKVDHDPKMTAEQKADAKQKVLVYLNSHLQRLKQVTQEKIDLAKLVYDVYVPLYDKYFEQSELQTMVDFYKSPTGQKALDLMPKLMNEGTTGINAIIIPKMKEVSAQLEEEDKAGKIGPPAFQ